MIKIKLFGKYFVKSKKTKTKGTKSLTVIHANGYVFNPRKQISAGIPGVPHSANGWIHCWEPFGQLHAFSFNTSSHLRFAMMLWARLPAYDMKALLSKWYVNVF